MNTNDQVHIHTRRIREQPFLHILHLLEEVVPVVRHKHLVARLERVEHATEEDLNVVESSEQEVRGGASVTALAPLVLALELIDLLRGLARNEPKEHIRLISRVGFNSHVGSPIAALAAPGARPSADCSGRSARRLRGFVLRRTVLSCCWTNKPRWTLGTSRIVEAHDCVVIGGSIE